MIVDVAIYDEGRRRPGAVSLDDIRCRGMSPGTFLWLGMHEPTLEEFDEVVEAFDLHPLAVEDAVHAQQRPKAERYGDSVFVVLKPARYVDSEEVISVGQIMLFVGSDFVVTVRHGDCASLTGLRKRLEADPDSLQWGPTSVLHAVADKVVDDYASVLAGLDVDIDQIEERVFSSPEVGHGKRIYLLKREVLEFRRAVDPLVDAMTELTKTRGPLHPDSAPYLRDVHDHVLRISEHIKNLDSLLDSALSANLAQVGVRQNEDMRKISAWVAIAAVPTMIAGVYGMNFEHMPELEQRWGYPAVVALMAVACTTLYLTFKRRGWL